MTSAITEVPPAPPSEALAHFSAKLAFETDCSDVREGMKAGKPDFVLLDVRGPDLFARGHVPGAISIPHRAMTAERMAAFAEGTTFVVYCAGPHCNGADKAAVRLARLSLPVKIMIGGITGWTDEGFPLDSKA
jgi:rhodanese-related sulfurtransferase